MIQEDMESDKSASIHVYLLNYDLTKIYTEIMKTDFQEKINLGKNISIEYK